MARIHSIGFELNSNTFGIEFSSVTANPPTVQGSTVRSGTYALQSPTLSSGSQRYVGHRFDADSSNTKTFFVRFYLYIASYPDVTNTIFTLDNTNPNSPSIAFKLSTTGTLQCLRGGLSVGTSSALNTDQWYRIEFKADYTSASGSQVTEFRIDGSTIATKTNSSSDVVHMAINMGGNLGSEAATSGQWFYDDVAINDDSGSFQNSWAGAGGIIHLKPNAVGDNTNWTPTSGDNYTNVDEVTPDDATSMVTNTSAVNTIDDYNLEASGLSGKTINLVQVGIRIDQNEAAASDKVRIKATSGGTVESSSNIDRVDSNWHTNASAAPFNYPLTLYDLPGASTTPWTATELDTAQIGVEHLGGTTTGSNVSTMWLLVDFSDPAPTTSTSTTSTSSSTSTSTSTSTTSTSSSTTTSTSRTTSTSTTVSATTSTSTTSTSSSTTTSSSTSSSTSTTSTSSSTSRTTSTSTTSTSTTSSTSTSKTTSTSTTSSSTSTSTTISTTTSTSTSTSTSTTITVPFPIKVQGVIQGAYDRY